jgi:hypothetical protein
MLVTAFLLGGLTLRDTIEPDAPAPDPPAPNSGLICFRQRGVHAYCDCLDRLESARALAGQRTTELPRFDNPLIRYAMRHPRLYPVITVDTEQCLRPTLPPPAQPGNPS